MKTEKNIDESELKTDAEKEQEKNMQDGANEPNYWKIVSIGIIAIIILNFFFDVSISVKLKSEFARTAQNKTENAKEVLVAVSDYAVAPEEGVVLPVVWNDLGKKMIDAGVIDAQKMESIYANRGGLSEYDKQLLYGDKNGNLKITPENSGLVLNLLWAFGLANKNAVLENGPMQDERYGGAGNFASTGGWTLAKGNAMDYYSKFNFAVLDEKQQKLVEEVSKNIYRPCCGNSTYFPDCNHGMAMLGLLELMAYQGATEAEMYKTALAVNSYWFESTYKTLAKYFDSKNVAWGNVNPKEVLGSVYSSGAGYKKILSEVEPVKSNSGGGCGI